MTAITQVRELCDGLTVEQQIEALNLVRMIDAAAWALVVLVAGLALYLITRDVMRSRRVERAGAAELEARLAKLRAEAAHNADLRGSVQDASPPHSLHTETTT